MKNEIIDLCGADILCMDEATHIVALDRVDPRQRPYKICEKHKAELIRLCGRDNLKVEDLIEPLAKKKETTP